MVNSMTAPNPNEGSRNHTQFVQVDSGIPVKVSSEVLGWVTDEGLRPSDEWLAYEGYYGMVLTQRPQINRRTQSVSTPDFMQWDVDADAGTVTQKWVVTDLTDEQQQEVTEQEASAVRTRRLQLLLLSDYTQGLDFAGDREAWATYRQELRDITSQAGFPWEVVWPVEP